MFPQCDTSDQTAIRGFAYSINQGDGLMNYNPKDFDLYKVGEFDSEKGEITGTLPELIVNGVSLVNEK